MQEAPIVVQFSKLDGENREMHVVGAELTIVNEDFEPVLDKDGKEIKWVSDGNMHSVSYLPVGVYYLCETKTPVGYQDAEAIKFIVDNTSELITVEMVDDRTHGFVELTKYDAETNRQLSGVVFNLISVNDVIDPVTGATIFEKDQIIEILTTDGDGYACTTQGLPIGVYGPSGMTETIKYKLVEVKAAAGQYDASTGDCDIEFEYVDGSEPLIKRSLTLKNDKPNITVTKTGTPNTFVGKYNDRDNVTVVKDGDKIEYTITVKNDGSAPAWNVVVRDAIPTNTKFINLVDIHGAKYDAETNTVYWAIDKVPAGATIELKFTVEVNNKSACEIVNIAQYAMPDQIPENDAERLDPMNKDNEWKNTDAVVHQTIEFHKTATIAGGTNKENATAVSSGDTITYHLHFKSTNNVYNLSVYDVLPKGVSYVSGSATINGKQDNGAMYNPDFRKLTFSDVDVTSGEIKFEFKVVVDDIAVGSTVYYENVALANYSKDSNGSNEEVESEHVTHYAENKLDVVKHGTPKTYEGDVNKAFDVTVLQKGEEIVYEIIATNNGTSAVKNVVISDAIPAGTVYVNNDTPENIKVWVNKDSGLLTWAIDNIDAGKSVSVKFTVRIVEQKAQLIVNAAHYDIVDKIGETAPQLPDNSKKTNDVVHQVIEFHKTSQVAGGTDKNNAVAVAIGDTITYTLELITKENLTNVDILDVVPDGLRLVPGSIAIKNTTDSEWIQVEDGDILLTDKSDVTLHFNGLDLDAGTYYFKFSAVVEHIAINTEKFYINQASVSYDRYPNDKSEIPDRDSLLSEEISHVTVMKLEGNKTGQIPTYIGDYESRENVTVVSYGDEITYSITVANMGASDIHGLIISDKLPEFTRFVKAENDGKFNEETGCVIWNIETVEAGKSVTVEFVVKCDVDNEAKEIRNKASYAIPENPNDIKDEEWVWTDEVIYQTAALKKGSSIKHGTDGNDAPYVAIGSKFTYTITFDTTNTVYGLTVQDVLPKGLTFIPDTAVYTLPDGKVVKVNDLVVGDDRVLTFPTIDEIPAGSTVFAFDVKVEDVAEYDRDFFFINTATATVKDSENSEKTLTLTSEQISHKTIKTNATDTPVLGFESTSETIVWALIAVMSAIAMIALSVYGFSDKKKKR
jgi:uncharacterized repeat protein (TIGR01451 family)